MTTTDPAERLRFHVALIRDKGLHPLIVADIDAALAAAYQRGRDEAVGPYIGVRLRDARWVDSQHYDHYHDHGETVTHEVGEWCPHQLIGQNWPCPPQHDETAESAILDAQADRDKADPGKIKWELQYSGRWPLPKPEREGER